MIMELVVFDIHSGAVVKGSIGIKGSAIFKGNKTVIEGVIVKWGAFDLN